MKNEHENVKKMKNEQITLTKIFSLDLKDPIIIEMKESNNKNRKFSLYYKPFKIYAFGSTVENCLRDFQEQLYLLYKLYTTRAYHELSRETRKQKAIFLGMINANASV